MPKRLTTIQHGRLLGFFVGCLVMGAAQVVAQTLSGNPSDESLFSGRQGGDLQPDIPVLEAAAASDHAGAQAMLAELLWRGEHVPRDEPRALALAVLAVKNAAPHDPWIDDIHHGIYCAASPATREAAGRIVAAWREQHPLAEVLAAGSAARAFQARRTCVTGEVVDDPARSR